MIKCHTAEGAGIATRVHLALQNMQASREIGKVMCKRRLNWLSDKANRLWRSRELLASNKIIILQERILLEESVSSYEH